MATLRITASGRSVTIEATDHDLKTILTRFDQAFRDRGGMWIFASMDDPDSSAGENAAIWASAADASIVAQFDEAVPNDVRKALAR